MHASQDACDPIISHLDSTGACRSHVALSVKYEGTIAKCLSTSAGIFECMIEDVR